MRQTSPALALFVCLAMAACSADEGDTPPDTAAEVASGSADNGEPVIDMSLAESGWLLVGEDGAVYTTMLDPDGRFRDFRNGEPVKSGSWERSDKGDLCFVADGDNPARECWSLGRLRGDNTMRATDANEHTVELRKVAYLGPAADTAADTAEGAAEGASDGGGGEADQ